MITTEQLRALRLARTTGQTSALSTAQLRVLRLAESNPDKTYNGRIRRTAECLGRRGLVTSNWWPRKHGYRGDITEVWTITITDSGRQWLAELGGAA